MRAVVRFGARHPVARIALDKSLDGFCILPRRVGPKVRPFWDLDPSAGGINSTQVHRQKSVW